MTVVVDGDHMVLAEAISGPMQTAMCTGADVDEILEVLTTVAPAVAS